MAIVDEKSDDKIWVSLVDTVAERPFRYSTSTSVSTQLSSDERATNADAERPFRRSTITSTLTQ